MNVGGFVADYMTQGPVPTETAPTACGPLASDAAELTEAFAAFSAAAKSLERSYFSLGQEVCRLRKELEEERDLRRRRDALAEISALLAHEIRNPLGSMELFAGLLAGSVDDGEQQDWIEQILSALRLLSATVNNVLEFHSRRPLELTEVELNDMLRSLETLLTPVAERAGMRWIADLTPSPLWIGADQQRLQQVFLNVALNAFRFAAEGGVLRVGARTDHGAAVVSFADKGPGIVPEMLERIFETQVTTAKNGSGLGLAIAKHIVEQHGGTISVLSRPGEGASVEIRLPLVQAKSVQARSVQAMTVQGMRWSPAR